MKRNALPVALTIILAGTALIQAQAPAAKDDAKVLALVQEVQAQQAQIAENQTKIETKLADVTETIRVARIFTSRAGGKHVAPAPGK